MTALERLMTLDPRWLYLLVGLAAIIPILVPLNLPVPISESVQALYDRIESMDPGEIVLVSFDYGPSTGPENDPMAVGVLRHCLVNDLRVVCISLWMLGGAIEGREELQHVVGELDPANGVIESTQFPGKEYGKDFMFFGYKDGGQSAMRLMSDGMHDVFPVDFYGTPLDNYELGRAVHGYDDVSFVMSLATGIHGEWWANLVNAQFNTDVAVGCTAVSAPKYFAFYESKQMFALLPGLKGAAEYETLIREGHEVIRNALREDVYSASKGSDVQSVVYSIITLFIIIGNIAFIGELRRKKQSF